jgi:hypothetical protein
MNVLNIKLKARGSVKLAAALAAASSRARSGAARVVELVGAEARLALLAVDHRVGEVHHVARRFPVPRVLDDRRVEADHVVAQRAPCACHQAFLTLRLSSTPSGP